jgi:hypothetical protein
MAVRHHHRDDIVLLHRDDVLWRCGVIVPLGGVIS